MKTQKFLKFLALLMIIIGIGIIWAGLNLNEY